MIRLKANAAGFQNANSGQRRAVLEVQTFRRDINQQITPKPNNAPGAAPLAVPSGGYSNSPGDTMFVDIRNINFDTNDNPGAVGLYFPGAQNSSVTNVKVDATNSFAGFLNLPGAGGGARNIEVQGGKHALYADPEATGTFIVGAKFHNQTDQVIVYKQAVPLTMVGFEIIKNNSGAGIETGENGYGFWSPSVGVMTLVDGTIIASGSNRGIDNAAGKNLYLKNVYVADFHQGLIQSGSQPIVWSGGGRWRHIREYAYTDQSLLDSSPADGNPGVNYNLGDDDFYTYNVVNGAISQQAEHHDIVNLGSGSPPSNLIGRHLADMYQRTWQNSSTTKNVVEYGAKGDGLTDDTQAIKNAIWDAQGAGEIVYFPAGKYAISEKLWLPGGVKLVGAGRQVSSIVVHDSWRPTSGTETMIHTTNSATSDNFIGFMTIKTRNKGGGLVNNGEGVQAHRYDRFTAVHWEAGTNSSMMGVAIEQQWHPNPGTHARDVVKFTGNGGGKHYFLTPGSFVIPSVEHSQYRKLYLQSTTNQTDFYSLNVEHSKGENEILVNGASNVNFYLLKREGHARTLAIWNSNNINVFGSGGMRESPNQWAHITIGGGSQNITLANIAVHTVADTGFGGHTVVESFNGQTSSVRWPNNVSYFKRGSSIAAEGGEVTDSNAARLKVWQLRAAVREAKIRWMKAGANASLVRSIDVSIGDLSGSMLGQTTGHRIVIDSTAAGHGWYTDRNMRTDNEFRRHRKPAGMDLLTVVMHEFGHVLGYDHNGNHNSDDNGVRRGPKLTASIAALMTDTLATSERNAFRRIRYRSVR